ncbi:hypothetical protein Tco_1435759 [Tanacetum coccineum]
MVRSYEVYLNQKFVDVIRVKNEQGYGQDFMEEILVKRTNELEPYIIITDPFIGIVYENSKRERRVMNMDELPKFFDATLNRVMKKVEEIIADLDILL